jgi:hypothetical protein
MPPQITQQQQGKTTIDHVFHLHICNAASETIVSSWESRLIWTHLVCRELCVQPWPPDAGESGGLCSGTLITAGKNGGLCSGTLITAGKSVWWDARDGSKRPQTADAEWTFQWQKPRRKKVKKKGGNNLVNPCPPRESLVSDIPSPAGLSLAKLSLGGNKKLFPTGCHLPNSP